MEIEPAADPGLFDMPIADLVRRWPATFRVFQAFRMACVGCHFSNFDTAREAIRFHHVDGERFEQLLQGAVAGAAGSISNSFPNGGKR